MLFPDTLTPNGPRHLDHSLDRLERRRLNPRARQAIIEGTEDPGRWGQDADFTLTPDQIRTLLNFWAHQCHGAHASFSAPVWFRPHDTPTDHTPLTTTFRFANEPLILEFPGIATYAQTTLKLWQCPWEVNPPTGYTAALPARAHLIDIHYAAPIGPETRWRYTDWETPLDLGDALGWFDPAKISLDNLASDDRTGLLTARLSLHADGTLDAPIRLFEEDKLTGPLTIRIHQCDPADSTHTAQLILTTHLQKANLEGRTWQLAAGRSEKEEAPIVFLQHQDNLRWGDAISGINEATYQRTAHITHISTEGDWPGFELWLDLDAPIPYEKYFADGLLVYGTGLNYRRITIKDCWINADGHDLKIHLTKPVTGELLIDDAVTLIPGWDGTYQQFKDHFNSQNEALNSLAFPHTPTEKVMHPPLDSATGGKGK